MRGKHSHVNSVQKKNQCSGKIEATLVTADNRSDIAISQFRGAKTIDTHLSTPNYEYITGPEFFVIHPFIDIANQQCDSRSERSPKRCKFFRIAIDFNITPSAEIEMIPVICGNSCIAVRRSIVPFLQII
jgi:hypothetical protein